MYDLKASKQRSITEEVNIIESDGSLECAGGEQILRDHDPSLSYNN